MRGALMYGPGDVRVEDCEEPRIVEPTDAVIRVSAACVCGSDLWPYRGIGVEAVGTKESMMQAIQTTRPGGNVGFVGVTHGVAIPGMDLFWSLANVQGGPAPVRRFLPELIDLIWT